MIKETDLYQPIYDMFKDMGYEVKSEVENCDIVAKKDDDIIIVEMKTSFNLKLITQAVNRQKICDSVFIAIPSPKRSINSKQWRDKLNLLRRLELGLLLVHFKKKSTDVEIKFMPKEFDRRRSKTANKRRREKMLTEFEKRFSDLNVGGSNKTKIVTAYRENVIFIASCLKRYGTLSTRELREIGTGDKTTKILYDNHYGWFTRESRGKYCINNKGIDEMKSYEELEKVYNIHIEKNEQNNNDYMNKLEE